ncbi:hypothetical protein FEM08_15890 [Flavobacterium gilvum]|nr:hypothetical protein FEM08_15890 [Flavobacterium gilvum]
MEHFLFFITKKEFCFNFLLRFNDLYFLFGDKLFCRCVAFFKKMNVLLSGF